MSRVSFHDLACPKCGQREEFHVDITATAYLDASGPTVESDYHWDEASGCTCLNCHFDGCVADFVAAMVVTT